MKRILHPSDFSTASARAFTEAVGLAKRNRAELTIAHVITPVIPMMGDAYVSPTTMDQITRSSRAYAERGLAKLVAQARKAGVRATAIVLEGNPWQQITRAATSRRAGLLVMGTHGRSGLAKMFLGSVAARVIASAPCPVLTVRGRRSRR